MNRIMAPFAAPTKVPGLQGKSRRVRGAVSFGGSNGLLWLSRRNKYCHNGGIAFGHQSPPLRSKSRERRWGGRGDITEVMAPHCGTLKMPDLQE
jgi:hypothetical protein